jgi:hypothetical protein
MYRVRMKYPDLISKLEEKLSQEQRTMGSPESA